MSQFELEYREIITQYRNKQLDKIPVAWRIPWEYLPETSNVVSFIEKQSVLPVLSALESEITSASTNRLISQLQWGSWTSLQVVEAFAHRASVAHQLVNPLTEIFYEEAFERARELDEYFKQHSEPIGPLHGLPISIKDEFDLEGQRKTLGLVSRLSSPVSSTTSPNIEILISQGAIPFVKTNVPTAAFNIVTNNNVFGETTNPYQRIFGSGGSSGGEAALVALRGSPLGIATDLGGSIRQPCSFTGVFGMKPTSNRVPHWNENIVVTGLESLNGTNGCVSNDVDGLELYFKSIIDSEPWLKDTRVVPITWKSNIKLPRKLKFAMLFDDGKIRVTPPIMRALETVKKALEEQGHEVVEFKPIDGLLVEVASFANTFMNSGGLKNLYSDLIKTNEPVDDLEGIKQTEDLKVSQLWELQKERTLKVNEFWKYWQSLKIDGLISPVTALAGFKFKEFIDFSYSPLANVIDFPSAVFPVLKTDRDIDVGSADHFIPRNEFEEEVWNKYDANISHGVPIGLQLIGPRYQEEKVIEMIRLVTSSLTD